MGKITKIEYDAIYDDLTVWFEGNDEPFSEKEFKRGSHTYNLLRELKIALRFAVDESDESSLDS